MIRDKGMKKEEIDNQAADELEKQAIALYEYVKELSQIKYESELRREGSLIQQSSQMQTAFSFMTAAVFMAAPVIIEHRGKLSLEFFLISFSIIVFFLFVSLVTASLAQVRRKYQGFLDIDNIENFVSEDWENLIKRSAQLQQWVRVIGKVQKDKACKNDIRVLYIRISMWSFFASIGSIVICFIIGIYKLL